MPDREPTPPPREDYPGVDRLDALELHRADMLPLSLVGLAPGSARVVDAEGVPVAVVDQAGHLTWGSPRSPRPFEGLHRGPDTATAPVALVDATSNLADLPSATATVAVLASTADTDEAAELGTVRRARRAAEHVGADLVIIPLGQRAEQRAEKLRHIRAAYAPSWDLTSEEMPDGDLEQTGGLVIFLTGLSGSGKSTVARALHHYLVEETDLPVTVLDGDVVRHHLSRGLTFSPEDRDINIRRIGWVAAEIARHGGTVICSPIAPFDATRKEVRQMIESRGGRFLLVHVATPLEECERRDRKGLYAAARRGDLPEFTGISSPYEAPVDADIRLDTTGTEVVALRDAILDILRARGWLNLDPPSGFPGGS